MTEPVPTDPPSGLYPPPPYGWQPPTPPRRHAEMNWKDLAAFLICLFSFGFLSPLALILAVVSNGEAKHERLRQHAVGMIGLILGAIGSSIWVLFIIFAGIGAMAS